MPVRAGFLVLVSTACAPPEVLEWEEPEDNVIIGLWWQNVDSNEATYEGTCALLREDGTAFALVPSLQWMYRSEWSAGDPGVIVLREGSLKLGSIEVEHEGEDVWNARYSGLVMGGMEATLVPGCDAFDLALIDLD